MNNAEYATEYCFQCCPWKLWKLPAFQFLCWAPPGFQLAWQMHEHTAESNSCVRYKRQIVAFWDLEKEHHKEKPWEGGKQAAAHNILRYKMRCGQCNFTYVIHFISNANAISLIMLQNKRENFITSASAIRHAGITKHPICSRTNRNQHFPFRWE